jgi:hypothetical protein
MKEPKPSVKREAEQHVQKASLDLGVEDLSISWFDGPIEEPDGGKTWGYVTWTAPTVVNLCKQTPFSLVAKVAAHEVHHCWEYGNGELDVDEAAAYEYSAKYVERGIEVTHLYQQLDLDDLPEQARDAIEELIVDNISKATQLRENEKKLELLKSEM